VNIRDLPMSTLHLLLDAVEGIHLDELWLADDYKWSELQALESMGWMNVERNQDTRSCRVNTTMRFMLEFEKSGLRDMFIPEPPALVDHYAADEAYGQF
jgi:hypothetical protein